MKTKPENIQDDNEGLCNNFTSDIFLENPLARFATGIVSSSGQVLPGREEAYKSYLKLRGTVYVDEKGILPSDAKQVDGTEIDIYDENSTHFCVIENCGTFQRVVASMRIIKGEGMNLPIASFFPSSMLEIGGLVSPIEISRYICRHHDTAVQKELKWPLYTTVLAYILRNNLGPTFAVIEEFLEAELLKTGVPLKRLTEPKFVKEYNTTNIGVMIDTEAFAAKIKKRYPDAFEDFNPSDFKFNDSIN